MANPMDDSVTKDTKESSANENEHDFEQEVTDTTCEVEDQDKETTPASSENSLERDNKENYDRLIRQEDHLPIY